MSEVRMDSPDSALGQDRNAPIWAKYNHDTGEYKISEGLIIEMRNEAQRFMREEMHNLVCDEVERLVSDEIRCWVHRELESLRYEINQRE